MPNLNETKETKYSFATNGNLLNRDALLNAISSRRERFPHINGDLDITGTFGESGVVVSNSGGEIIAGVRNRSFIPQTLDLVTGEVEFGGKQSEIHLETSLERSISVEQVKRAAQSILYALSNSDTFEEFATHHSGMGAVGSEPEAWLFDENGNPYEIKNGGELQANLKEDVIGPISDPEKFLKARAEHILKRKSELPYHISAVDTSVFMTGSPQQMKIGAEGEIGLYVLAIQDRLYRSFIHAYDPLARQLINQIAIHFGFEDYEDLHSKMRNMAYWNMAASHASVGLHHRRTGSGGMWIPEMEAIAVADIFNSNLATVAEMLTMSTPVTYGITPVVEKGGNNYWPRDYRTVMKYLMDTTYPADFILTPERMHKRITSAIVDGLSHTLDRASYVSEIGGVKVAAMHARVRNRMATSEPKNQTGRIEFTGCCATPSILDETARNCFLQVLTIAAYEALAHGEHPVTYWAQKYPNLSRWEEQKDLAMKASVFGFKYPEVKTLIEESLEFLNLMRKYSTLVPEINMASERIVNLLRDPATSLEEYLGNPQGPICEVLQQELQNGVDPVDLAKKIEVYQISMAQKILSKD